MSKKFLKNNFFLNFLFLDESLKNVSWNEDVIVPCRTTAMLASVFVGCGVVAVALTAAFTDKIRLFVYQVFFFKNTNYDNKS